MKKLLIIPAFLFASIVFLDSCGNKSTDSNSTLQTEEATLYQCPMLCEGEKTYDKPGQCPVCNMNLTKIEIEHDHEGHDHAH